MIRNRKAILLLTLIAVTALLLSQCFTNQITETNDPRGKGFVGSAECRNCHQAIYDLYTQSTHYNTTQPVTASTIGNTTAGIPFHFSDSTYIRLLKRDSGVYQAAFKNNKDLEAHRMDIQFGVKHAQTFLYWKGERTYEHPLSFYNSINAWGTSPGYPATQINFNRFVGANCFECHSSFIGSKLNASTDGIEEVLDKNTLLFGIDCERCHGPAINHVNYHNAYPDVKEAKYMTSIASLSRQQQLDVCAVCHSGNNKLQDISTFKFRPGDQLSRFFITGPPEDSTTQFDVHGNQHQLMAQSPCYIKSQTLTCSSCHNPHTNAGKNLQVYSSVCMSCHKGVNHSTVKEPIATLQNNCIDCHMPIRPSSAITFQANRETPKSAYLLRTHKIAIYAQHQYNK
jgi:predicted CXXCH cytochrome family protein